MSNASVRGVDEVPEHVFRQQDSDHLFPVPADDREAGVAAFDDGLQHLVPRSIPLEHRHLGPWNHDLTDLGFRDGQDALKHGQLVGIQHGLGVGLAEPIEQIARVAASPLSTRRRRPYQVPPGRSSESSSVMAPFYRVPGIASRKPAPPHRIT